METENKKFKPFEDLTYVEKRNFILNTTYVTEKRIDDLIDAMFMLKKYKVLSLKDLEMQNLALEIATQEKTEETVEEIYNEYIEEKEGSLKVYNTLLALKSEIKNEYLINDINLSINKIKLDYFDNIMEDFLI